jgi:hypothetical protein
MYTIEIYKINLNTNNFDKIEIITDFYDLNYMHKINGVGECSFSIEMDSPKAILNTFIPFSSYVAVKKDGFIVWHGPIRGYEGNYQDVSGRLRITAFSPLYHLSKRYTSNFVEFLQTDQTSVAWQLINTSQGLSNGLLFIENNSLPTGILKDRTYEYGNIAELLINLSNLISGFDFDFTAKMDSNNDLIGTLFNTYYPIKGSVRNDLPSLEIGENVQSFGFAVNDDFYNNFTLLGSGTGETLTVYASDFDLSKGYTRLEEVSKDSNIVLKSTLQQRANLFLQANSTPKMTIDIEMIPTVRPLLTEFEIGDSLNINIVLNKQEIIKKPGRIIQINVSIDEQGVEFVTPRFLI